MMGGNWGKILKVDLDGGTFEDVELAESIYRDYLGGSGLAAKWFFDNRGWKAEPLSPENPLMIMLGPISGTSLPGASRLEICARAPLTGIWGESCMGGHFAPQLKRTGYDGIIITGASDKPVYLWITDEGVEIRDASHLWGKDTYETEEELKGEVGEKRAQVMCIGPAGENLVKYANVMNDKGSAAGRCGLGAVMGSKKLKAVVALGSKKPPIADEEGYKKARKRMNEALKFNPLAGMMGGFGTNSGMNITMAVSDVPVKNWRESHWDAGPERLGGVRVVETILTRTHSCYGCPVNCKRVVEVKTGPFALEEGPGSEYEAASALGTLQRMDNMEANHKANELCNRYGMDVISCGSTIAYATEAYEGGLITEADTGGIKLGWNQPETLIELIEKTAHREGFGDDLAEGSRTMSNKYGGEEFAIHVKGLECPMHDPRAFWGMALTYATSIRGACHVNDTNLYTETGVLNHKDLGIKRTWPYKAKGKAAQTIGSQIKGGLTNSAIICQTCSIGMSAEGEMESMLMMLNPVTGFDYTVEELTGVGNRIWYLKRAIGNLCGATREEDKLPRRLLEPHIEGVTSNLNILLYPMFMNMGALGKLRSEKFIDMLNKIMGNYFLPYAYKMLMALKNVPGLRGHNRKLAAGDPEEIRRRTIPFEEMIEEFYRLRGIDAQGRPSRKVLGELGLEEVADALHSSGGE